MPAQNATLELISLATNLHLIFIALTIIILIRLIVLIRSNKSYQIKSKIYERWVLFYRALLSAILFSGVVVMAIHHFHVAWQVWLMVFLGVALLITTILEFVRYKESRAYDQMSIRRFESFSLKHYLFALAAIISVTVISLGV